MRKIIEIKDIVKRFKKVVAVDHVSFTVSEGEVLSILGPSGCGKTTVLRTIAGLEDIDHGEITLDGKVVSSPSKRVFVPPEKRGLGLVFQSYALWPHMTVGENVAYGLKVRKFPKHEINRRVKASLELVGLLGLEDRYPSQLSGGQQQRIALARSLAYEPKVILLDEPLSNLDLKERERMRGELSRLLRKIGITAIYVTHDQEEAFILSDRIILMCNGKIVQEGTPNELFEKPQNLFVANFIGRSNIVLGKVVKKDPNTGFGTIRLDELASYELQCVVPKELKEGDECWVCIRANEINITDTYPSLPLNVIKAEVVGREYRGSVTDHKVVVGEKEFLVTTSRLCDFGGRRTVFLQIDPRVVTVIPAKK